jgi:phytoene desaturase
VRVVVIGAGLGGLAAACHLVGDGHQVSVVERSLVPGGRAGIWETAGYRIDTGPSVLTMRDLLERTFAAAGATMDDHVRLLPVDPMYRATFPDQGDIYVRRGRPAMVEEVRRACGPGDAAAFERFSDWLGRLYRLEMASFIDRNFDTPLDLARPAAPAVALARLGAFRRMAGVVESYFADQRLRQLFSFQSLYAGLSPFDALAVYCVITYMDTVEGVWFPEGGIHSVARGLQEAAEKGGATFHFNTGARRITRQRSTSGAVTGVELVNGGHIPADAVVANPDLPAVYRELLPGVPSPRRARRAEYSPSCLLWLAGVQGQPPPGAAHHNVHFGGDWKGSFDALLRRGVRQPDPSILVSLPALTDPGLARDGGQVVYALEPVPNLDGQVDWHGQGDLIRDRLLERLTGLGYPVAEPVVQRCVGPLEWEAQGLARGTPFSFSHRFTQSGPFRPNNVDRRVPGLVLVGSGTLPGVGVPMVLISGRLAAERVRRLRR